MTRARRTRDDAVALSTGTRGQVRAGVGVLVAVVASTVLVACAPSWRWHHPLPAPAGASAAGLLVSAGRGWSTAGGLEGPLAAPGSCRYRHAGSGAVLPDPSCTPGAIDAALGQATLTTTLCRPGGFTSRLRPPPRLTEPAKASALAAYGAPGPMGSYELDHLVPLELGGSSDTRNLWPEPDDHPAPGVANSKDIVEDRLHALVCNAVTGGPSLSLADAQRFIAEDWTTALAEADAHLRPRT